MVIYTSNMAKRAGEFYFMVADAFHKALSAMKKLMNELKKVFSPITSKGKKPESNTLLASKHNFNERNNQSSKNLKQFMRIKY